ncbi:DUF5317 domain-containing protein [Fusibacter sp. JL298sf-3]
MYLEALLLGFIIGIARNGRLMYFNASRFKGWTLAFVAFLVYVIPYALYFMNIGFKHMQWLSFVAMVLILFIVLLNIQRRGMKLIFIGTLLNLIVMAVYGGRMPIDIEHMRLLGYSSFAESVLDGTVVNYIDVASVQGVFQYLGKVVPLPSFYPLAKVISIGDIVVSIGICLLIQNEMRLQSTRMRGSMVQFSYKSKF